MDINGKSKLAGWVIVYGGPTWLIGKVERRRRPVSIGNTSIEGAETVHLHPVYQLGMAIDPRRGAIMYRADPILLLSSFNSLDAEKLTLKPIEELSAVDQKMLEGVIADVEQRVKQMKAEEAGLVFPGRG